MPRSPQQRGRKIKVGARRIRQGGFMRIVARAVETPPPERKCRLRSSPRLGSPAYLGGLKTEPLAFCLQGVRPAARVTARLFPRRARNLDLRTCVSSQEP